MIWEKPIRFAGKKILITGGNSGIAFLLVVVAAAAGVVAPSSHASRHADETAAPNYAITIPPGYLDWKLISVAHEEGSHETVKGLDFVFNRYAP